MAGSHIDWHDKTFFFTLSDGHIFIWSKYERGIGGDNVYYLKLKKPQGI